MKDKRKKIRVVVRQFIPRNVPYQVSTQEIEDFVEYVYPQLQDILYIGWAKRIVQGKRKLLYLAATSERSSDARKIHKSSEKFGKEVWDIKNPEVSPILSDQNSTL